MRSNVVFLAIGLFVADSAFAGPCKPRTTASQEVTTTPTATSERVTFVLETATTVSSDTTLATTVAVESTITKLGAEKSTAVTTTVIANTSATDSTTVVDNHTVTDSTAIAETTTAADTAIAADTTTLADTTTVAETTTTAAGSIPTFSLRISGGPLQGSVAQQNGSPGASIVFNPTFSGAHGSTYAIDPSNSRVRDTQTGGYLCAYYGFSPVSSDPPRVSNCFFPIYTGDNQLWNYLTCHVASGLLSCTAPRGSCQVDDVCTTEAGVNDQFYYRHSSSDDGDLWYIGSATDNPTGYTATNVAATKP